MYRRTSRSACTYLPRMHRHCDYAYKTASNGLDARILIVLFSFQKLILSGRRRAFDDSFRKYREECLAEEKYALSFRYQIGWLCLRGWSHRAFGGSLRKCIPKYVLQDTVFLSSVSMQTVIRRSMYTLVMKRGFLTTRYDPCPSKQKNAVCLNYGVLEIYCFYWKPSNSYVSSKMSVVSVLLLANNGPR